MKNIEYPLFLTVTEADRVRGCYLLAKAILKQVKEAPATFVVSLYSGGNEHKIVLGADHVVGATVIVLIKKDGDTVEFLVPDRQHHTNNVWAIENKLTQVLVQYYG